MNGFSAKEANKSQEEETKTNNNENIPNDNISNISDEISKLNNLREKGVLTQEEFDKAKNKLLNQ